MLLEEFLKALAVLFEFGFLSFGHLFIVGILVMPGFFEITAPDFGGYLVLGVFALLIPSVIFTLSHAIRAGRNWIVKMLDERKSDGAKANKV